MNMSHILLSNNNNIINNKGDIQKYLQIKYFL